MRIFARALSLKPANDGRSNPPLRPGCFGGQPLPDRPSLMIRKTPVSGPYEPTSICETHPFGTRRNRCNTSRNRFTVRGTA
jgi:hypothetical protein